MKKLGLLFLIFFSANAFALPQVTFLIEEQYVSENDGLVTVTASLDSPATALVTVPFTVSGTANPSNDHDLRNDAFVFTAGTSRSTVTFRVFTDTRNEIEETIILDLQSAINADLGVEITHTVFLLNNDGILLPEISFAAVSQSENEGNIANVIVNLSEPSNQIVTVSFSVTGTSDSADHNLVDSVVTFFPGETSAIMSINLVDDGIVEGAETIDIQLLSPMINASPGANTQHTLTIIDSSSGPILIPSSFFFTWKRTNIGTGTCEESYEADDDGLQDESQGAFASFLSSGVTMAYSWRKFMDNTTCSGINYLEDGMILSANVLSAGTNTFEAIFTISDLLRIAQGTSNIDLNNYNAGAGACAKNDWASGLPYYSNNMPWLPSCSSTEGINAFTFSNVAVGFSFRLRGTITGATTLLLEETINGGATWTTWATFSR